MSRIRAADTKPEMIIRRGLHARGLRFRLHDRRLPGTPDLVFKSAMTLVFVHGCFWHGHDCSLGVRPKTNQEFWDAKIARNQERDQLATRALAECGWRVVTIWECALRGPDKRPLQLLLDTVKNFVRSEHQLGALEIAGV